MVALVLTVLVAVGVVVYVLTRSGQAQVDASVLPVTPGARQVLTYVDCSKVNAVAYFADNPCQTFVLVRSRAFGSPAALLAAEARQLRAAGWHHPSSPLPFDLDGTATNSASLAESWAAPDHAACAIVLPIAAAIPAEASNLFPADPYDIPRGMYDFYRKAKSASSEVALWVRMSPGHPPEYGPFC